MNALSKMSQFLPSHKLWEDNQQLSVNSFPIAGDVQSYVKVKAAILKMHSVDRLDSS